MTKEGVPTMRFQLSFRTLVHRPATLAGTVENLNEKQLQPKLRGEACEIAAQEGARETLKWARNNDCPWGSDTCTAAPAETTAVLDVD
jgi:hypothetical protein